METEQSKKKRKPGKSPEKDVQNDEQVETATTKHLKKSNSGQKKAKLKKPENNSTGAQYFHV